MLQLVLSNLFRFFLLSLRCCFFSVALLPLLSSCHVRPLHARLERVSPSYLASTAVHTPDICGICFNGDQVVISWFLPQHLFHGSLLEGQLTVRLKNNTLQTISFPIHRFFGYYVYRHLDRAFCANGSISSYKAAIVLNGEPVAQTYHHLWAEIICCDPD